MTSYPLMLALAVVHGCFWSGLLAASAAHTTELIPEQRRAEGIGVWGLSTIAAVAIAPAAGFWLYDRSWAPLCAVTCALNLGLAGIAYATTDARAPSREPFWNRQLLRRAEGEGRISRLVDRVGHRKVLLPALVSIAIGLALLAVDGTRAWLVAAAVVFGVGFGCAYPVFAALIMSSVDGNRRGAAFGGILAAFDTGIGTGSLLSGWLIGRSGYGSAFGIATALALLALPYFLFAERRLERDTSLPMLAEGAQ